MAALRSLIRIVLLLGAGYALNRFSWRSGARDSEAFGSLPGDDIVPHPMLEWTRATTIHAAPDRIWPWLVQMGYGRGGWYTNERVDRLIWGVSARNANRVLPQFQRLEVGDIVADGPDYAAYFHVRHVHPERAIVYHSIRHPRTGHPVDPADRSAVEALERRLVDGGVYLVFSWAFILVPDAPESTRLIIRTRADYSPAAIGWLRIPLGYVDVFHAHTILRSIKRRAEATGRAAARVASRGQYHRRPGRWSTWRHDGLRRNIGITHPLPARRA
jgi:hypothetical protein